MSYIKIDTNRIKSQLTSVLSANTKISSSKIAVASVYIRLSPEVKSKVGTSALYRVKQNISDAHSKSNRIKDYIAYACGKYENIEKKNINDANGKENGIKFDKKDIEDFIEDTLDELGGYGSYAGVMLDLLWRYRNGGLTTVPTIKDVLQLSKGGYKSLKALNDMSKADISYIEYMRKSVMGYKYKGFVNAGTFKGRFNQITGAMKNNKQGVWKGVKGSTVVSTVLSGVLNAYENFKEEEGLSTGRAVGETMVETAIDVGTGLLIGTAVTVVAGTVGAPAVLVAAGAMALKFAADFAVKKITGDKDMDVTEVVSDFILDSAEATADKISKNFKQAKTLFNNAVNCFNNPIKKLIPKF